MKGGLVDERPRSAPLPLRIACGLFLGGWFLFFSRGVLAVHFSPDDMMNLDNFYWTPGVRRLLYSQFLIWRGYYRPMGGLFYLPVFSIWGLNPAPYHVVLSLVLAANVCLLYRLARVLGANERAAFLVALVACYHAGLANLYYNTAFVYDALCGGFYLAALVYYCGIRAGGQALAARQMGIFAALVVCALNSKEMALTLPGVLLAYEFLYHPKTWRGALRPVAIAAVLTLLDLYGKIFGHDALTGMEGYRPVFTWRRFLDYQKTFLGDAAFWHAGAAGLIVFWILLSYLAWRPGARTLLRFAWAMLLLTPLPIAFLPGKSQACLYIPTLALALFAAAIAADLARAMARILTREPLFRRLRQPLLAAALSAAVIFYWGRENLHRQQVLVKPVMAALGSQTWQVIEQMRALDPHVRPHSHVVFLNDPFTEWDMLFIADLWFHDRSVTVHLQRLNPIPIGDVARAAAVFDYRDGKLILVR
ncbi:MAG TPA: hypothetical protein VMB03_11420 [Bryobacteraceae bacterium]|nr:hypothetical protein [Bryobacteraceae bacterium]